MAFQIVSESFKTNKKYRLGRRTVCFKINDIPAEIEDPEAWIKDGMRSIVEFIVQDINPDDKVGFTFGSDCFSKGDAHLSFRKASSITFQDIWELLGKIYQSNSEGFHSENFRMTMTQYKPFRGMGRQRKGYYNTYEEECNKRRGIVVVNNEDNLCLPRALVVAMAYLMNVPYVEQIRRNVGKRQDREALKLMKDVGIAIPPLGAGIEELEKFQQHLTQFKITVYIYGTKGREVLFEGPNAAKKINLLFHKNHYNVITNLTSAFACGYYCTSCHIPFNNKKQHRCTKLCPCCQQSPPCEKVKEELLCSECNRKFRGLSCYNNHKVIKLTGNKTSICLEVKQCPNCLRVVKGNRDHNCREIYCNNCSQHQPEGHYCFIKPDTRTPRTKKLLFVFYDLETRQDHTGLDGEKIHIPNLCVFQYKCSECIDKSTIRCKICFGDVKIFKNEPIKMFMEFLLGIKKNYKSVVIIAHNAQSFDSQFILNHVLKETDITPQLIMRGTKILLMGIDNMKFIDSLNYFPMSLAELPKAFDLGPETKKGYFPHLFNTIENANYVGCLPDVTFYDPDNMKPEQRSEFLEWYEQNKHSEFNFEKEIVDYCISDVDVLTKACVKFRKLFLEQCNVDPFVEVTTIASACHLVFRRNYLQANMIGLIPNKGYRNTENQSLIAIKWLLWEEHQRGINIIHSLKQREVVIAGDKVDGYCMETNEIYEFQGCFFHGCPKCFVVAREEVLHDDPSDTLDKRLRRTNMKTDRLKQRGFSVIEMWECVFRRLMTEDGNIKSYTEAHPLLALTPLNPREAFYGGRTGNCKTYYEVKPGEKVKYVDVCSLYPSVCKYGKFPVGHPIKIYIGEECKEVDVFKIEGVIKCAILPPSNLYHPVLPMKANNKLMFGLCRSCMLELNQSVCSHSEKARTITGTWIVDEVLKAIETGYKVIDIHEIWEYKVMQYDKEKGSEGMFTQMMNKFVKIKQEASGWPKSCVTEEEKKGYIEKFLEREDIQLDYDNMGENLGLRSLAKLLLNSFWGKFGQRENLPKTAVVRHALDFFKIINDPAIEVNHIVEINEETIIVNYENKEEAVEPLTTVNVCTAAYTTTQARLKLYTFLEKLQDRVLYFDTGDNFFIYNLTERT